MKVRNSSSESRDANGRYAAPDLSPGPYEIKAALPGFSTIVRSGVRLTVGRDAVVDLALKLGTVSDQITVVGEAPTVDLKTGSTGGLVTGEQIEGLPLNGRSYVELATLTPGVQLTQTGGQGTSTGFGAKLSVNGSRYTSNLFTLDGTNLNDQFSQAGSASGNVLGVEAVREFQVLTNSFTAEYGHHTGGGHQRRDQVGHQRRPWVGVRVPPRRRARREEFLRHTEAALSAEPVWWLPRRTHPIQQNLPVW